jgi:Family of unknown function (DUF6130)
MFAAATARTGHKILAWTAAAVCGVALFAAIGGHALPTAEAQDPAAVARPAEQPPAKLIVDPPKPEPLARGVAIIQFRAENLQIAPVFGPAAAAVSPRLGHLHLTLDDAPWHWAHTSNDPVIVADLSPGPHKILFELADANHKVLTQEVIKFEMPRRR